MSESMAPKGSGEKFGALLARLREKRDSGLPTRIQRMTDGIATEEITLEKIRINGKIDPARFAVVK